MFKNFFLSERNMMIAILINGIIITLLYFPELKNNRWLIDFDHFLILIFLIEAIVKVIHYKPKGYFSVGWNVFDFIIVIISLPSLIGYFMPLPDTSIVMVLRLFRLIRLVKFMKFIPRMTMIMAGLGRALKASVFVMFALIFLNFLLALFTCHFYGEMAPQYFGNPLTSSYTIFQMFTVEGWNEIPIEVLKNSDNSWFSGITRFYFVLVVLFGGIFGLSLANAVFVDEMTMDNNQDLEAKIDVLQKDILELKEMLKNQSK